MLAMGIVALLAWGSLSFGAVYQWGYIPLFVGCVAVGAAGLLGRREPSRTVDWRIAFCVLGVTAAILAQLIPLPARLLELISPNTVAFLKTMNLPYAAASATAGGGLLSNAHALSLVPIGTALALVSFLVLSLFTMGTVAILGTVNPRLLVRGIIVVGVVLSAIGIVQSATFNGLIYGFWKPESRGFLAFGPFINRNHFAGWMLMAVPLAVGYLIGLTNSSRRRIRDWYALVRYLSSPDASEVAWIAFAALLMSISVVMTTSRLGISCLAVAFSFVVFLSTRRWTIPRIAIGLAYLIVFAVLVLSRTPVEDIVVRFSVLPGSGFNGRVGAWREAMHIARDYPIGGIGLNTYSLASQVYAVPGSLLHFTYAHNDYLQLIAEGGVLVLTPALILLYLTSARAIEALSLDREQHVRRGIRFGACSGILAIGIQEVGEGSLQIPGDAALFCVLLAVLLHKPQCSALETTEHQSAVPAM